MRAHDTEDLIPILSELVHKAPGKSPLAIVSMDYELSDPANNLAVMVPAAGKCLPCQLAIDNDACISASLVGEILRHKPLRAQLDPPTLIAVLRRILGRRGRLSRHTFFSRARPPDSVVLPE